MRIQVREGGWGNASTRDIQAVLESVANELLSHFPGRRLDSIVVSYRDGNPVVLYERGPGNQYRLYLTARDRYWSQYAYQFAHELTHILTNFEHHDPKDVTNHSQWFEETLCEVGSLFVLKRLAYQWEIDPPYPHWTPYSRALLQYVHTLLQQEHRRWPRGMSPAQWVQSMEGRLRNEPYLRSQNELMANLLLPLFEENPQIWEAIGYLNVEKKGRDFAEYMAIWHKNAPEDHRDIIQHIMKMLGVDAALPEALPLLPRTETSPAVPLGAQDQ